MQGETDAVKPGIAGRLPESRGVLSLKRRYRVLVRLHGVRVSASP